MSSSELRKVQLEPRNPAGSSTKNAKGDDEVGEVTEESDLEGSDSEPESDATEVDESLAEFDVDAIKYAQYRDTRRTRVRGDVQWYYGVMWKGYLKTMSDTEEPLSGFGVEPDGRIPLVEEFWAAVGRKIPPGRKEPPGKLKKGSTVGELVEAPKWILKKWLHDAHPRRDYNVYKRRRLKELEGLPITKADSDYYARKKRLAAKAKAKVKSKERTEATPGAGTGTDDHTTQPYPSPVSSVSSILVSDDEESAGTSTQVNSKKTKRTESVSGKSNISQEKPEGSRKKQKVSEGKSKDQKISEGKGRDKKESRIINSKMKEGKSNRLVSVGKLKKRMVEEKDEEQDEDVQMIPSFGTPVPGIFDASSPVASLRPQPTPVPLLVPQESTKKSTSKSRDHTPSVGNANAPEPSVVEPNTPADLSSQMQLDKPSEATSRMQVEQVATEAPSANLDTIATSPPDVPMPQYEPEVTTRFAQSPEPISTAAVRSRSPSLPVSSAQSMSIDHSDSDDATNIPAGPSTTDVVVSTTAPPAPTPVTQEKPPSPPAPPSSPPPAPPPIEAPSATAQNQVPNGVSTKPAGSETPSQPVARTQTSDPSFKFQPVTLPKGPVPISQRPRYQQPRLTRDASPTLLDKTLHQIDRKASTDAPKSPTVTNANTKSPTIPKTVNPNIRPGPPPIRPPTIPNRSSSFVPRQPAAHQPPVGPSATTRPPVGPQVSGPRPEAPWAARQWANRPPSWVDQQPVSAPGGGYRQGASLPSQQDVTRQRIPGPIHIPPGPSMGGFVQHGGVSPYGHPPVGGMSPYVPPPGHMSPYAPPPPGNLSPYVPGGVSPYAPNTSQRPPGGLSPNMPYGGVSPNHIPPSFPGAMSPPFNPGNMSPPYQNPVRVYDQSRDPRKRPLPQHQGSGSATPAQGDLSPLDSRGTSDTVSRRVETLAYARMAFQGDKPSEDVFFDTSILRGSAHWESFFKHMVGKKSDLIFEEMDGKYLEAAFGSGAKMLQWAKLSRTEPQSKGGGSKNAWEEVKVKAEQMEKIWVTYTEAPTPDSIVSNHIALVIVGGSRMHFNSLGYGPWQGTKIGLCLVLLALPPLSSSSTSPMIPNPARPLHPNMPSPLMTPPSLPAPLLLSYGIPQEFLASLRGRVSVKYPGREGDLDVLYDTLIDGFKQNQASPLNSSESPPDVLIIGNHRISRTLRSSTLKTCIPRRTLIYSMGPALQLHPSLWTLRPIWTTGGLVTFSPTLILRSPTKFAEIMEMINASSYPRTPSLTPVPRSTRERDHSRSFKTSTRSERSGRSDQSDKSVDYERMKREEDIGWGAYLIPSVIEWTQSSWKEKIRCPDPVKAFDTLTNFLLGPNSSLAINVAPPSGILGDCPSWVEWTHEVSIANSFEKKHDLCDGVRSGSESFLKNLSNGSSNVTTNNGSPTVTTANKAREGKESDEVINQENDKVMEQVREQGDGKDEEKSKGKDQKNEKLVLVDIELEQIKDLIKMRSQPWVVPYRRYLYVGEVSLDKSTRDMYRGMIEFVAADDFAAIFSGAV
ncbi:hypothetical protein M231_04542 [Tremella mesenterica]|uniref:Uncharacterized protein n=1 Tax=Tremella mesenterica TaxID=5217 RepID=A0A4Q1BK76_TREME|nr:hypothetical protein M231_04542 [Tremella mesenterica]